MQVSRKTQFRLLLCLLPIAFWLLCEILFRVIMGPPRWELSHNPEVFERGSAECQYEAPYRLHPYLAFTYKQTGKCASPYVKSPGFLSDPYPLKNDPETFDILLTGASSAEICFGYRPGKQRSFFERILNERYLPPEGDTFKVYIAAAGAWNQPQPAIALLLHSFLFDGVLTFEGFNNFNFSRDAYAVLTRPDFIYSKLAPTESDNLQRYANIWFFMSLHSYFSNSWIFQHSKILELAVTTMKKALPQMHRREWKDSLEDIYPQWDGPKSEMRNLNYALYLNYVKSMHAIAEVHGLRSAFFMQPVPALEKELTREERQVVGDLAYGEEYRDFVERALGLRKQGVNVHSLLSVFKDIKSTLYRDDIHLYRDPEKENQGCEIVAENMVEILAKDWKLRKRF